MIQTKNLIIGAGLSGLACAYYLKDDYLILEKDSTPGGYCRTIPNKEYVWDYAGHFYHFNVEKYKKLFTSLVKPEEIVYQKKNTKIFYKEKLIDYPFQTNIHELDQDEFIDCLCDLYFREDGVEFNNFLDMLYAKFGKSITEKFLRPYNEKLYATDLHSLDKEAMGRFFPYADFSEVMKSMKNVAKKTYNDEFLYLKKGTGYFIDVLYETLDKEKILFNEQVVYIDSKNKIAQTKSGKSIHYENLVNSIPFNQFIKLFNDKQMTDFSDKLSYNKVLVFNIGFDRPSEKFKQEHWVYFPDKKLNFYRIGFYNNILNQSKLSVYVEIGFPKNTEDIDIEKEFNETLKGMKQVGIIDDNTRVVDKSIILMDPAYVHISTENDKAVKELFVKLEKDNIYNLGRYGRWTYNCMEDCVMLADDLAEKLRAS